MNIQERYEIPSFIHISEKTRDKIEALWDRIENLETENARLRRILTYYKDHFARHQRELEEIDHESNKAG